MSRLKGILNRAWRESKGFNKITNIPLAILFVYFIESGKSRALIRLFSLINPSYLPKLSYYYIAHAYFLSANYEKARNYLEKLTAKFPSHADAIYLLCDIDVLENRKKDAWERITLLSETNLRLKTWLVMSNLVQDEHEFNHLYDTWQRSIKKTNLKPYHFDVNGYIATGALRAGLYHKAEEIWDEIIEQLLNNKPVDQNKFVSNKFSSKYGEKALLSLKKVFDENNINFFLVSGTLLGCIRESRLLRHDKDADVGIWDDQNHGVTENVLRKSGLFYIQTSRTPHTIRAKHVNGTAIDIFIHYREPENYWHGGVKLKWSNTPFKLTKYQFLGQHFYIPENYDLYLKENYGNWRVPKIEFDSSIDTNNATIINQYEMKVHEKKKLALSLLAQSKKI